MAEHIHKFGLITDGPDCDECEYSAILGVAYCKCGEQIGPTEIERRINAVDELVLLLMNEPLDELGAMTYVMRQNWIVRRDAVFAALEGENESS